MTERLDTEGRAAEFVEDYGVEPRTSSRDSASGPPGWSDDDEEVSLLEFVNVLLKRWKLVVGTPVAAAVVAAIVSFVIPAKFTATTTFVPESEAEGLNLPGGLAGIAAQFGVAVPGGGSNSPRFYSDLLESRTLQDQVLLTSFADPRADEPADSAPLLDLIRIRGDSERERLEEGREELADMMSIRVNNETSIVSVSVETRYRALSADVANLFIDLVNRFNLETRQNNAQNRRRFVERRVTEAEAELLEAEGELRDFLLRNRQFQGSPDLTFQYERLQRRVVIKQEVFSSLRRQFEEARIQEVNDTPVITVIDLAVPPDEKSSPKRGMIAAFAFFLGGVVALSVAFGTEFVDRARAKDEDEFEEFTSRWGEIKADLGSLFRRKGRGSRG
jgi:uncharacterized protein involved in exopolysaccharide biosynthesis